MSYTITLNYCLSSLAFCDCSRQHMIFVLVVTQWYGDCIGVPHALVINLIMDGEDILDNFSNKEEIDAGIAAPHRRKVLFNTLEKKRQIVNEAFSAPCMVRPTAHQWSV
jgi:hypothetical protein